MYILCQLIHCLNTVLQMCTRHYRLQIQYIKNSNFDFISSEQTQVSEEDWGLRSQLTNTDQKWLVWCFPHPYNNKIHSTSRGFLLKINNVAFDGKYPSLVCSVGRAPVCKAVSHSIAWAITCKWQRAFQLQMKFNLSETNLEGGGGGGEKLNYGFRVVARDTIS